MQEGKDFHTLRPGQGRAHIGHSVAGCRRVGLGRTGTDNNYSIDAGLDRQQRLLFAVDSNNLPITNKDLWKPLAATYYLSHYTTDMSNETIGIFIDWDNDRAHQAKTQHSISFSMARLEGIKIIWDGNPFNLSC